MNRRTENSFWQRLGQYWFATKARRHNDQVADRKSASRAPAEYEGLTCESLEDRILLAAHPSIFEQYMLELINLARRDPGAYASSLGINLNEGLSAGTISDTMKQPLAFNVDLIDAARTHSQWMLDTNTFSHYGPGNSTPGQRMQAAGYQFAGNWTWAENIGYRGTTGSMDRTVFTRQVQEALFVDANYPGRGHRLNILNDNLAEIGVGVRSGMFNQYRSVMATQDFAKSDALAYLTGVVYDDSLLSDWFYTPGEGMGGITVTAVRDGGGQTYSTNTWASGGFSLELPKGRYSIMVDGPGFSPSQFMPVVLMGTANRKFDFINGRIRQAAEIAVEGNGLALIKGDSTPRLADGTDFGQHAIGESYCENTFTIRNIGNIPLQLTGSPRVEILGAHANDFVVTVQPPTQVNGVSEVTFTVRFDPLGLGLRTAQVRILNSDSNESSFTFSIAGTGVQSSPSAYISPNSSSVGGLAPLAWNITTPLALPLADEVNSALTQLEQSQPVVSLPGNRAAHPVAQLDDREESNSMAEIWQLYSLVDLVV